MKTYLINKIYSKTNPEIIFWVLLFIIVFSLGFNFRMQSYDIQYDVDKYNVITSDGVGYYSYLPSTFISKEFQISNNQDHYLVFDKDPATKQNKYFIGSSILMAPFFGAAHLCTSFYYWLVPDKSFLPNGYSFPYQLAIIFAGVFYLLIGFFYIKKILLSFKVKKEIIFALITLFALGSQLMGLSSYESSFSHVYAFCTISVLLYNWHLFTLAPNLKRFLFVGTLSALLIIIRPTDILILLTFPIFWTLNGYTQSITWLKQQRLAYLYLLLIGFSFLYLQLYFWELQSGGYYIWSYSGEQFDFSNPQIWNVLFSYKKGLFVYTPLLITVFICLFFSQSIKTSIKFWFLIFFLINTYVISSWWCWWYGGSFGMRPWMDFMPIIILLTALSLNKSTFILRGLFYLLSIITIPINIIQNYQYSNGIMHWDTMTHDKYWQIFLETDEAFNYVTYDPPETYKNYLILDSLTVKIEDSFDSIFSVERNRMFHTLYETPSKNIFPNSDKIYIKVSFDGKLEFMREAAVLTCNKNLENTTDVKQQSQRIISYIRKTEEWINSEIIFDLGEPSDNETDLSLFFYNNQRNFFWFKNVTITFYNYKTKQDE